MFRGFPIRSFRSSASRRGMTLIEIQIVCVLGVILTTAVITFGVFMAKLNKSSFSQLKFSLYSKKTIEDIAKVIRYAKFIQVTESGNRLLCTDDHDITSAIYYKDEDKNPNTLSNNRLYYISNTAAPSAHPEVIGRYISPFPGKAIFAYLDRTSAVEINFRVGDPSGNPEAAYQVETGPGPQGLDIRTAFGPRNSYLY